GRANGIERARLRPSRFDDGPIAKPAWTEPRPPGVRSLSFAAALDSVRPCTSVKGSSPSGAALRRFLQSALSSPLDDRGWYSDVPCHPYSVFDENHQESAVARSSLQLATSRMRSIKRLRRSGSLKP